MSNNDVISKNANDRILTMSDLDKSPTFVIPKGSFGTTYVWKEEWKVGLSYSLVQDRYLIYSISATFCKVG